MTDQNLVRGCIGLTGGTSDTLDCIDGTLLYANDVSFSLSGGNLYAHYVDSTIGGAESSPTLITPNANSGNKRHALCGIGALTKETIFIPVSAMLDGTSAPGAIATKTSTNGSVQVRDFAGTAASNDVRIPWSVPPEIYAAGKIKYSVLCLVDNATGPSNEGVSFQLSGYCSGHGDTLTGTFGTAISSEKTAMTQSQYTLVKTTQSADVTVTDLTVGELAMLKLSRVYDAANDTYGQVIGLVGVFITYTRLFGV